MDAAQVNGFLRNKPTLEALEPIVAWDPPPVYVSGYSKLRDGCAAARVWREKARAADPTREDWAPVDLKALESLAAEASRIYVALPEAKVRQTLSTPNSKP